MGNDLLKKLEEKINEAIETIELSRMEVADLKEQNIPDNDIRKKMDELTEKAKSEFI